jgi:long-chain acyl-CoA synthetase
VHSEWQSAHSGKKQILGWTLGVGKKAGLYRSQGQPLPFFLSVQNRLAEQILFRRLRHLLGGRIRFLISGGAPLAAEIARFFYGVGLTVYEGYGLTEAAPVVSCNLPGKCRLGSVGPALPGVEVTTAPDGEILVRGPNVMQGYYQRPEETREMIDAQGWLHTGDVGKIDAEGFIHITDRKKDLIITSEGENVAPQNIETLLKQDPLIEEVCVVGDRRPYLTALIVPNLSLVETLAREPAAATTAAEMLAHPATRARFHQRLDEVNRTLPLYARVRNFTLLAQPFSQDRGELTPTLKVKRRVVAEMYRDVIEAMYPANRPPEEKQP